jgi:LCP family protein required for cell wall assembly
MSTPEAGTESTSGIDITSEAYNIYITGIDQWESEKGRDMERSDVNMIVTVNPRIRKILLTSIPRDTYITLHTAQQGDKLTHTGVYGVNETLDTVEDWLGYHMDYYVKMNFSAVVDVINAMGGIEVYSPKEFVPTKRSWWTVKKGWNHMNGKEALAFARERKAFNGEDSARVENQQRVVDAILRKMMTSPTLLTKYPEIVAAASNNMSTNLTSSDMEKIVKMQLADLGEWDIESQKIKGNYEMDYVASLTQDQQFLVYKAFPSSVTAVKGRINAVMNPTEAEIREYDDQKRKSFFMGLVEKITGNDDEDDSDKNKEKSKEKSSDKNKNNNSEKSDDNSKDNE